MPWAALLVMALSGFLLIATETMPAGLLPQIAAGLQVGEGAVGQLVGVYALGTVVVTLPAIALTRGVRRKPLLLVCLGGFVVANAVTAVSGDVVLSLVTRFVAGAFSGVLWGMLAGYAARIAPAHLTGRAVAVASAGTPVGLAAGTPLGAWLGGATSWRWSFGVLGALTVLALVLAVALVPGAAGQPRGRRYPVHRVAALAGVPAVLAVIALWMLGHNTMYTYVAAYLRETTLTRGVDVLLAVFGVAAVLGLVVTGLLADRALRPLVLSSTSAFVVAGTLMSVAASSPAGVVAATVLWGLAFGGAAPQLLTAIGRAAGEHADVANALLATTFNLAIFGAGLLGALLLGGDGRALPAAMAATAAAAVVVVALARRAAFPPRR